MDVARAQVVYEPLDVIPGRRSVVIGVGWMNTPKHAGSAASVLLQVSRKEANGC